MKSKSLIAILTVMVIVFIAIPKVKRFIQIDSCLDHGGSWNYEEAFCDTFDETASAEPFKIDRLHFESTHSFADYGVSKIQNGKASELDLNSNPEGNLYRTILREAFASDTSNFAGHYSFTFYSTGPSAERSKIIDRLTGKIFDGPESNHGYSFQPDSRMLITNPPDENGFYDNCSYCHPAVYLLDEDSKKFKKLK